MPRLRGLRIKDWHARKDSNPQHSVLETDALPIELLACKGWRLTGLLVNRMATAPGAILLDLHTIGHGCLVLGRRIVTTLALGAGKGDESTHETNYLQIPPRTGTMEYDSICVLTLSTVYSLIDAIADAFHKRSQGRGHNPHLAPFSEANSRVRSARSQQMSSIWKTVRHEEPGSSR